MHKLLSKDIESLTGECSECGSVKIYKDSSSRNGKRYYYYRCVSIRKEKSARVDWSKYPSNEDNRIQPHGLTGAGAREYVAGKSCEICGKSDGKLVVDHCHNRMRIRGVLCHNCNVGIGFMNDDIERLQNAIEYLSRNSE